MFSTKRRSFPDALAYLEEPEDNLPRQVSLGDELKVILARSGFKVNERKLSLRARHQRQMVTGLIVNERNNVPREYVRGLRAVLHCWRKFGEPAAAQWFFERHYKRNRPGRSDPDFKRVVRGRVQYVGAVRGWGDRTYQVRPGKGLVVDDHVFDLSQKKVSLSKVAFCNLVHRTANVDYSGFRHVFQRLSEIGTQHAQRTRERATERWRRRPSH